MKPTVLLVSTLLAWAITNSPSNALDVLAQEQTSALTVPDRLAAARAEAQALDRDEAIKKFEWAGPDGASGLIIISGQYPDYYGMGRCRNFVHVIRHPKDGGVNPTFEATVCRNWEGKWSVEKR